MTDRAQRPQDIPHIRSSTTVSQSGTASIGLTLTARDEVADRTIRTLDLEDGMDAAVYRRELGEPPLLEEMISALREELPRAGLS